jgi:hypothetical protein
MKNVFKWMIGVVAWSLVLLTPSKEVQAQPGSVSYQTFYDELSPYGDWIYDGDYGYVWAPQVGNDFRPYYTNGQWAMTDYGNTWVSGYDWGWAPFHYGRWTHNRFYGWVWVPGTTWGPAWVSWRSGGGNYGWAPMGPGISINISFGNNYYTPYDWWTFVPCSNIYSGYYGNYWRGAGYNNTYINNTVIINNTYNKNYVYGPRRNEIEQVTGGRVKVYNLRDGRAAGRSAINGNNVSVYRPSVRNNAKSEAPREFVRAANNRSIRSASPTLTGQAAVERNQRELKANPVRQNGIGDRTANTRNSERAGIERSENRNVERVRDNNRVNNIPADRSVREDARVRNNAVAQEERAQQQRAEQDNARVRETQVREQRMQQERAQRENARIQETQMREQSLQQERMQRENARAQEAQMREQRVQQQRAERNAQVTDQRRMERQQERQTQQAPQREWRRPEPQQVERSQPSRMERPQPMQRQSAPAQRGGIERGGRR